jgi:AcrR family transcriptional regulator
LTAEDRQDQIVEAAMRAFAEGGYAGTTTDQVARLAGVSQPYVVRRFGSKHALFLAAYDRAVDALAEAFRQVKAAGGGREEAGRAYAGLIDNRQILLVLMHGFASGADPQVGPRVRERFAEIVRVLQETIGADADELRDFLARGMLINTLIALQIPQHMGEDPLMRDLAECTFGEKMAILAPGLATRPEG